MSGAVGAGRAPLAITRLSLVRFRSHARFERDFDARPVAIHGPNGAGKTNILEAVSMLSPGRGLRGASLEDMAARPDAIGWAVRARADGLDGGFEAAVTVDRRAGAARKSVEIDGAAGGAGELGARLRMVWLTPAMDRLWIEGAAERRRFLDRATLALDPAHGARSAAYERAMRERNRLLREPAADPRWFDALEATLAETGVAIDAARAGAVARLAAAQEAAASAFPAADLSLVDADGAPTPPPEAGAQDARRGALRDGRRADLAAGRTLIGPHRADLAAVYRAKGAAARLCSTGEQKALLISLTLATARALRADLGAAPLLLLDEIAAHLDPGRRAALYDEICALGAQAWMTGAEAGLFDALGDRAQQLPLG